MKTKLIFILAVVLMAVQSQATTRFVSSQGAGAFTTIGAAISAAVSGDTILIGPGTFNEAPSANSKKLVVIGTGWDQTIVTQLWNIGASSNGSVLEGLLIDGTTGNYGVQIQSDSITIRRCFIRSGFEQVRCGAVGGRGVTVEDCILLHTASNATPHVRISDLNVPTVVRGCLLANLQGNTNNFAFLGGATSGTVEVYNCVFVNHRLVFNLSPAAGAVLAVNNLFYDWAATPTFGTYNPGSVFDYNAGPASPSVPGTNVLPLPSDPFVNYDEAVVVNPLASDFHLHVTNGAAFVNTGHPSLLDFTDGSRSDFGAYGGPKPLVDNGIPNWPWAINVVASPNLVGTGTPINASATVRVGPSY